MALDDNILGADDIGAILAAVEPGDEADLAASLRQAMGMADIGERIFAVEANQVSGRRTCATWTELAAVTGSAGQGAEVLPTDTGTHTDPVVGGTKANAGTYIWSVSPAGWKWVSAEAYSGLASRIGAQETKVGKVSADEVDEVPLLRTMALRETMRTARGVAEDRSSDASLLRDMALRETLKIARGVAADVAIDIARLASQPAGGSQRPVSADIETIDVSWSISGRDVTVLAGPTALYSAGRAIYAGGVVTIPAPTSGHVDNEAVTLAYADPAWILVSDGKLAHGNVANLVVTGATTGYNVNADQGVIVRSTAGATEVVDIDYDWSHARYDLIEADDAGVLYLNQGTERERDAIEYMPTPTIGRIPLIVVRSTAWQVAAFRYLDHERVSLSAPAVIQRMRARGQINLHSALRAGDPVVIAGYGDSRTNLGGSAASPFLPNGPARDTIATSGFMALQGSDFKSSLPLFDHGDGAGAVHTHIGWNWDLLRAIQARYPGSHQYLNFGIGGTTSGNTSNGGTVTARLAGLTGSGATIAVIGFGMNELGTAGPDTVANLVAIGEACLAADIDPVFIAPARPNSIFPDYLDRWIIECRQNKAVADYLGAPYIDPLMIYGADAPYLADPRDCCGSNLFNHDSVYELSATGRLLSRIVLDI